jgi:hypothetical protein
VPLPYLKVPESNQFKYFRVNVSELKQNPNAVYIPT